MFQRVRRPVTVAIDGRLVLEPNGALRIEKAEGERDLYRQLAMLGRSPGAIARDASRCGLLARTTPLLPALVPGLAEAFATYRDGLAIDAAASMAGEAVASQTKVVLGAAGRTVERLLQLVVHKLADAMGMTPEQLAEFQQRADQLDLSEVRSGKDLVRIAAAEADRSVALHTPAGGPQPRWAQEWVAAGDISERIDRLGEDLDQMARGKSKGQRAAAMRTLMASRPKIRPEAEATPEELFEVLAPLVRLTDQPMAGSAVARERDQDADSPALTAMASGLLAFWQLGDSLGSDGPGVAAAPRLGDVDTWRSFAVLGHARQRHPGQIGGLLATLVRPERASDWAKFATECALWRDAIDAMGRVQREDASAVEREGLSRSLRDLERRLVSMRVLADSARLEIEGELAEEARERLLRWITARCADAGVEPRPQSGLVGTEGRALWTIREALRARPESRFCQWSDCREPLPPGSYAHRRYCDRHRRKANQRRMAARRARGVSPV